MKLNLFGATHTQDAVEKRDKEAAREWQRQLKRDMRKIDRQINHIIQSEEKTKKEIKSLAAKKEIKSVQILAKEIVRSRKGRDNLLASKAQMNSVVLSLQQQIATLRMGDALRNSTDVMHSMNQLIKLPEFNESMMNMASEMEKLGVIEGVMSDAVDNALDDADIEHETEQEMAKILKELALDVAQILPDANASALPQAQKQKNLSSAAPATAGPVAVVAGDEEDELERRLRNL